MKCTRIGIVALLAALLLAAPAVAGPVRFVAADMLYMDSLPDRIHLLDAGMNSVGSFLAGAVWPNGVTTDGANIYSGHFWSGGSQVIRYDFAGNVMGAWSDPGLDFLQGMTMVGGQLAVLNADAVSPQIRFYNPFTGVFSHAISGPDITGTVEGLTYDGSLLWALGDTLVGLDPLSGATLFSLPNAAYDNGDLFGGTALATNGAGELMIGAYSDGGFTTFGKWYRVSKTDGSVIASGSNGVKMMGLEELPAGGNPIPEPSTLLLFGGGLIAATIRRRRARK